MKSTQDQWCDLTQVIKNKMSKDKVFKVVLFVTWKPTSIVILLNSPMKNCQNDNMEIRFVIHLLLYNLVFIGQNEMTILQLHKYIHLYPTTWNWTSKEI